MRKPCLFVVRKQSRNEGNSRAIAPVEIFKYIFSYEVQHQLTINLLLPKISSAGCGNAFLLESIDIRDSIHGDEQIIYCTLNLLPDFVFMAT